MKKNRKNKKMTYRRFNLLLAIEGRMSL